MKKINFANFTKHLLRIIISAILGFTVLYFYDFKTFYRVILFFGIYLFVSLILETIFKKFKKEEGDKKN